LKRFRENDQEKSHTALLGSLTLNIYLMQGGFFPFQTFTKQAIELFIYENTQYFTYAQLSEHMSHYRRLCLKMVLTIQLFLILLSALQMFWSQIYYY